MSIELRGGQARVAEQFPDGLKIRAMLEQMGGGGVAQNMGAFFPHIAHRADASADDAVDRFRTHRPARGAEEQPVTRKRPGSRGYLRPDAEVA